MSEERLLTVQDLVDVLHVSRSTVMGLLARGEIDSLTIRRARRIRATALRAFIEARTAQARASRKAVPEVEPGTAEEVDHAPAQRSG